MTTTTARPSAETIAGDILASIPPFDDALALRAYAHLSHTPDIRARQEREAFEAHIQAVVADALKKAETPVQLDELHLAVTDYAAGYLTRLYNVLSARSHTASAFITGGSRFPTRRNQKALAVESNREAELQYYIKRGMQRVRERIAALETPEQKSAAIVKRMCAEIDGDLANIAAVERGQLPGFDAGSFTASINRMVRGLHRKGFLAETDAVLDHIAAQREGLGIQALGPRNSIWKLRTDLSEVC